jgi:hypothetical protein
MPSTNDRVRQAAARRRDLELNRVIKYSREQNRKCSAQLKWIATHQFNIQDRSESQELSQPKRYLQKCARDLQMKLRARDSMETVADVNSETSQSHSHQSDHARLKRSRANAAFRVKERLQRESKVADQTIEPQLRSPSTCWMNEQGHKDAMIVATHRVSFVNEMQRYCCLSTFKFIEQGRRSPTKRLESCELNLIQQFQPRVSPIPGLVH